MVELLLATLPEYRATFRQLCAEVKDWGAIFECAEKHSIAAVLYHYLTQFQIALPSAVEAGVKRRLTLEWLVQLRLREALDEALETLEAAGVRAVALKGPLIGERVYAEPFLRPSSDVDLLVALTDLDRAQAALEAIGYHTEGGVLARYYRENHHHIHFSRPQTPLLELHFRATTGFGAIVASEELIARACLYHAATGCAIRVLSPEDEVLYLAVHATRHLFSELIWLYDLKMLLRQHSNLDWSMIWARARAFGTTGALALALEALDGRLGVSIPQGRDFAPRHRLRERLARVVLRITISQPASSRREMAGRILFRALLCDRPVSSAWFFRHRLLRFVRRRAQWYFPKLAPGKWSA